MGQQKCPQTAWTFWGYQNPLPSLRSEIENNDSFVEKKTEDTGFD